MKTKLFRFAAAPLLLLGTALMLVGAYQQRGASGGNGRPFALQNNDRVVFYGDSITDQRLYTTFVETFVVTRFPQMDRVRFVHSGWGGDRVTGGGGGPIDKRLDRDVIAYKPTVVTIMLGMNDGGYRPFDSAGFANYQRGYEHIVDRLQRTLPAGARLTLLQPSPYDDVTRAPGFAGGYNAVLARYGDGVRALARAKRAQTIDLNVPVVGALAQANTLDASAAARLLPDRVHPSPGGHLLLASALLKGWNAPALVSAVTIDAGAKRVTRQNNATVEKLNVGANGAFTWTQTDAALPFPLDTRDPTIALAVRACDVTQTLNQQPLVVTGLVPGRRYRLGIDGDAIGTFSAEEFARGVNLATLPTPMAAQAQRVHGLTLAHNNVHFARWRQVQVPHEERLTPNLQKALRDLDAAEENLVREQRALARPRPHRFELSPLPPGQQDASPVN